MELNKHTNANADLICGTWHLDLASLHLDGFCLLQRNLAGGCQFRFDFHENGEFVEEYEAGCGNDPLNHRWTGNWELGEDERTLTLQIENYPVRYSVEKLRPSEAYKKAQELQIIEITKEKMHLQFKDRDVQLPEDYLWKYEKQ